MKRATIVTFVAFVSLIAVPGAFAQTAQVTGGSVEAQPPQQSQADTSTVSAQPNDEAPKHVSTGWAALFKDTVRDFKHFPMRQSTWVILGVGGAAAYTGHFGDDYVEEHIVGNKNADKFFSLGQWVGSSYTMVASSVGLWAVGRYIIGPSEDEPRTNKWSEMGFDMMRAQMLAQAVTHGTKNIVRRDRPTGECCSFPSGHAASAFAAASVLERHLGYRGSWPFMIGAMYVGASRLVDNRHFLSDVLFGSAVGTASGWTVVSTRHGGNHAYMMQPVPVEGGMMIAVSKVER
jgi:hypothetical protein